MIRIPPLRRPVSPIIDWSNPLSKGLVFDFDPLGPRDLLGNQAVNSGASITTGVGGIARTFVQASSQYVDLGATPCLNFGDNNFGFEFRFTLASLSATTQMLIGKMDAFSAGQAQVYVGVSATTGVVLFSWFDAAAVQVNWSPTSVTLAANTPYHLVCQREGSSASIYINGVSVALTATGSNVTMASTSLTTKLGGRTFSSRYLDGAIEIARARNRALSAGEVQQLWQAPYRIYRGVELRTKAPAAATFKPAWAANATSFLGSGVHAA